MRPFFRASCFLFSLLCLFASVLYAAFVHAGYERGSVSYKALQDTYTAVMQESQGPDGKETKPPGKEGKAGEGSAQMNKKLLWAVLLASLPSDAPPRLTIKWDELMEESADIPGWIYMPSISISYPVMQGEDNAY